MLASCDTILIPVDFDRKSLYHAASVDRLIPKLRNVRVKNQEVPVAPWNLGLVFSNCPAEKGSILQTHIDNTMTQLNFTGKPCKTELKSYAIRLRNWLSRSHLRTFIMKLIAEVLWVMKFGDTIEL